MTISITPEAFRKASGLWATGVSIVTAVDGADAPFGLTMNSVTSLSLEPPLWQPEFFDHLLRSEESYTKKWNYVRDNPVREKLVERADDWPFSGCVEVLRM